MALILSNEERNNLLSTNECYLIGVLADPSKEDKDIEQFSILPNSNYISFYIKAISDQPKEIKRLDTQLNYVSSNYIGIDTHLNSSPININISHDSDHDTKVKTLQKNFKDKLIIFKPNLKIKKSKESEYNNEYLVYKNLNIISTQDAPNFDPYDVNYIPIPYVKYKSTDFEDMLLEGQNIIFDNYPDSFLSPEYVLCNDDLYFGFEKWEIHETNKKSWKCIDKYGSWKKKKLTKEELSNSEKILQASETLFFINDKFSRDIVDNYNEDEEDKKEFDTNLTVEIVSNNFNNDKYRNENLFVKALEEYSLSKGLSYDFKDLVNFHICIKTNLITILTGMTGTGKSELARVYAKMLNLSIENNTLLFMPVSPNYNEPCDVIGYMNTSLGLYNSSETGLLDFIIKADKNPEKMYMVIFDEMNLSQVEHWFAPFISLLEVDVSERYLTLYSPKTKCINDAQYPSKVKIGSNIRFIGTMNIDETTKDISDRLLDRANSISLTKISFKTLINNIKNFDSSESEHLKFICTNYEDYKKWIDNEKSLDAFSDSEIDFFDKLHNLIVNYDSQKGVSFRVLQQIGTYLTNIPLNENSEQLISKNIAIDLQVKQRIITKLKGTKKQFLKLIGEYQFETDTVFNSEILDILNSSNSISDFSDTRKEIKRKAQELAIYGYTN